MTKLADVIRPTPYFVAGQQQGYRVYPGRDRKQFAALGLRPGDLIKDIDGAALDYELTLSAEVQNSNATVASLTSRSLLGRRRTLVLLLLGWIQLLRSGGLAGPQDAQSLAARLRAAGFAEATVSR